MSSQNGSHPAPTLLEQVMEVTRQRRDNYDGPLPNFLRIALFWSIWLETTVTPLDVAFMMSFLKGAREAHGHQADNVIDTMGYMDCVDSMDRHMKRLGYEGGVDDLRFLDVGAMFNLLLRVGSHAKPEDK